MLNDVKIKKELYMETPKRGTALYVRPIYTGTGLTRMEESTTEEASDVYLNKKKRYSHDNGRTWSEWVVSEESNYKSGDLSVFVFELARTFDRSAGHMVRTVMYETLLYDPKDSGVSIDGKDCFEHTFYQISNDDGITWSDICQIQYEDGPLLSRDKMHDVSNLYQNRMCGGYNILPLKDGSLLCSGMGIPVLLEGEMVSGVIFFKGRWNHDKKIYDWERSAPIAVPKQISSRGLLEPFLAQLDDGRVIVEMRGSSTDKTPGRKWLSISEDSGLNWSKVTDLKYDTGEQFYAPSSLAMLLRAKKTGSLYWIGNISRKPPKGNMPRYPLYIAKVDESQPALIKDSLCVIDDYDPQKDTPILCLSNFYILEDRETLDIELYMNRIGEKGDGKTFKDDFWTADVYRYIISL